jgi:uncharacterized membrane protein YgcG
LGSVFWLAFCLVTLVHAEVAVPTLTARVTDLTGTLSSSQRSALEAELQAIEARSTNQIAVLMLPTTKPETIEQYSIRVVEAWKLGQKGKDNGLLILVAKDDRKVRIEVGYGLEGVIPDAVARQVIDGLITPRFKQGDFAGGLTAGIQQLAFLIEGRAAADQANAATTPEDAAALPSLGSEIRDLSGILSEDQRLSLWSALRERGTDRGKPFFILIVKSTSPDTLDRYAGRVLRHWAAHDNLDIVRSGVLVIATDSNTAFIELGHDLQAGWAPGAREAIVSAVETQLASGDAFGALQGAVDAIGEQIEAANANPSLRERVSDWSEDSPILLVGIVLIGTALRWILGPLLGALTTGGLVGLGAWWVTGTLEMALLAGGVSFVFILVGLLNWIALGLGGSSGRGSGGGFSGGGGGGGFSGGGGSFGGGGASGSW